MCLFYMRLLREASLYLSIRQMADRQSSWETVTRFTFNYCMLRIKMMQVFQYIPLQKAEVIRTEKSEFTISSALIRNA